MSATISYNGNTTEVGDGKTATLACKGKKAVTNISINFATAGSITYNGSTTEVEAGKTATLQCAGKKMISDVYVAVMNGATEYTDCITFTGETSDFTLTATYKEWDGTVEYSTDHNTWTTWDGTEISSSGQKLYLRGSGNTKFYTSKGARFVLSARAACSGNIQTLLEYSNPPTSIPATYCYRNMFMNCSSLVQAPALPATTLADNCYASMFRGCTSLTKAPDLPASTIPVYGYLSMFRGCTSLVYAPKIHATSVDGMGCGSMFYGCTSLVTAPSLPATSLLSNNCYSEMFSGCTSLTQLPKLPAKALTMACYQLMFNGCTKIKLSTTQTDVYKTEYRIPTVGTGTDGGSSAARMFESTGGTFKGTPSLNTTYYTSNEVV